MRNMYTIKYTLLCYKFRKYTSICETLIIPGVVASWMYNAKLELHLIDDYKVE